MIEIEKFILENEMSVRLKNLLYLMSKKYYYMNQLSVLKIYRQRSGTVKSIKELIEIYPSLNNEIGFISVEQILHHLKK